MSFSVPRHVPTFESSQRPYEDGSWGTTRRTHQNGHAANGNGNAISGYFEKKELPMYKDKPYSYAASGRQRHLLLRKRLWLGGLLSLLAILYWVGRLSPSKAKTEIVRENSKSTWNWLKTTSGAVVDWDERREKVKDAFILSWDGYEEHAWGRWYPH